MITLKFQEYSYENFKVCFGKKIKKTKKFEGNLEMLRRQWKQNLKEIASEKFTEAREKYAT